MDISSVSKDTQGKSPIVSTANKVNAKTAAKKTTNRKGNLVDVVEREARIVVGIRVFSE